MKFRDKWTLILTLIVVTGLLLAMMPISAQNGDNEWEWENPLPQGNWLLGTWVGDSSDVFAVGGEGTILYFNGSGWSAMSSGTTHTLWAVWGSGASNVFAVGENGTILNYDGTGWSVMNSGTTYTLWAVWGPGPGNVFAVGENGTILNSDGTGWSAMSSGATMRTVVGICRGGRI